MFSENIVPVIINFYLDIFFEGYTFEGLVKNYFQSLRVVKTLLQKGASPLINHVIPVYRRVKMRTRNCLRFPWMLYFELRGCSESIKDEII